MPGSRLTQRIEKIRDRAGFNAVAVSLYDYETASAFSFDAERWFHAASTIKVAFLLALFRAVDESRVKLESRLHVRNRFRSVADGSIFRVKPDRDADAEIHKHIGRAWPLADLARAMIVRSSNLATNLLFDFLGAEAIKGTVDAAGLHGIKVERGVEDEAAFEKGMNNEVTADGLCELFRLVCERRFLSEKSCEQMTAILLAQEFNRMIPAGLPETAKVAHKTGEISTACHDAGIVFLPDRKPYVLAILTESAPSQDQRQKAVAEISSAIFNHLTGEAKRDE